MIPQGAIYEKFDESMILREADLPEQFDRFSAGQDFGLYMANVKVGWKGDAVYALCDHGDYNKTVRTFNDDLTGMNWFTESFPVYCDPSAGERIQEITHGVKANNSEESGIDYICAKIERKEFFVSVNCSGVLSEISDYRRDETGQIVKANDHHMDALRYAIFSDSRQGVILA